MEAKPFTRLHFIILVTHKANIVRESIETDGALGRNELRKEQSCVWLGDAHFMVSSDHV